MYICWRVSIALYIDEFWESCTWCSYDLLPVGGGVEPYTSYKCHWYHWRKEKKKQSFTSNIRKWKKLKRRQAISVFIGLISRGYKEKHEIYQLSGSLSFKDPGWLIFEELSNYRFHKTANMSFCRRPIIILWCQENSSVAFLTVLW